MVIDAGVHAADLKVQYKFPAFSLGKLAIGWKEGSGTFVKAESGGESAEMTGVLEDLIKKLKGKIGEKAEPGKRNRRRTNKRKKDQRFHCKALSRSKKIAGKTRNASHGSWFLCLFRGPLLATIHVY